MDASHSNVARRIAQAACDFERHTRGHLPKSVTVVLSDDTLAITMHGALSPAEKALAETPTGAAQVQEFYQYLFANTSASLRQEIGRIAGAAVREAAAQIETATGAVKVFASGTVVQVFLLDGKVPADTWSGSGAEAMNETA
jgi:uncharacterized protein YbcI